MREYDDYQGGKIQFGGRSIKEYSLNALLGSIGYVPSGSLPVFDDHSR